LGAFDTSLLGITHPAANFYATVAVVDDAVFMKIEFPPVVGKYESALLLR
jgi:hypothetical protein